MPRQEGQFLVEDFFINTGGLNSADSPFLVQHTQCVDGQNFDYVKKGAIEKRAGHVILNDSPFSNLISLGLGLYNSPTDSRALIRLAGTNIENYDINSNAVTTLASDQASPTSNFLNGTSTTPGCFSMFTTPSASALWCAGAGASTVWGVYRNASLDLAVTANGTPAPTASSFTASASGSGGTLPVGVYKYTLTYVKTSTSAQSNAVLEATVTVTTGQEVALAWTLTNNDTTKYSNIIVYRSAVDGSAQFTEGDQVKTLASSAASYTDTGSFEATATVIPRAGNLNLDNSTLPAGTYTALTTFKQRLVTANGSTVYISDINKSESWPLSNIFNIPSGGSVTALAVMTIASSTGSTADEVLVIFKQREVWVVSGNDYTTFVLSQLSTDGTPAHTLVVKSGGFLSWISYRGVHLWNGSGKPLYISQPIEDKFQLSGDIDKTKLTQGFGFFAHNRNEVQWYLSSNTYGTQQYCLRLDLRLTEQSQPNPLINVSVMGVFSQDALDFPIYAGTSFLPTPSSINELYYIGDNAGSVYSAFAGTGDAIDTDIQFQYTTPFLSFGEASLSKQFNKVVVWVLDNGPYNLSLNYWANYRYSVSQQTSNIQPASSQVLGNGLVWGTSETAQTCTISVASPAVVTLANHGFVAGETVTFTTTGALPTGLSVGVDYFVKNTTTNTFELSATLGGVALNTTGTQSGTQKVALLVGGLWDVGFWDSYYNQVKPVVFNLASSGNNNQGDSLRLQLAELSNDAQVVIYGFSVYYTELGLRK